MVDIQFTLAQALPYTFATSVGQLPAQSDRCEARLVFVAEHAQVAPRLPGSTQVTDDCYQPMLDLRILPTLQPPNR